MGKIKIIARMQDGAYAEEIIAEDMADSSDAQRFFHAFHPQDIVKKHTPDYADFVLVFRTDADQMQEFHDFLRTHDIPE